MRHYIDLLYVFIGAGTGGMFRYLLVSLINKTNIPFYLGTISVNAIGCFLIGISLCLIQQNNLSKHMMLFVIVGILGGFTTFSAFSAETILYLQKNQSIFALLNVLLSLSGILIAYLGYIFTKNIFY